MRPVQLLGIAFVCAVFAAVVTFVSTGGFQAAVGVLALPLTGIVGGITFIAVLLGLSLLLLAVDPAQVQKPIDRAVLLDDEPEAGVDGAPKPAPGTDAPRS
jgi:hypothetical protein